ncbi:hypothetical protein WJX72_001933 [[Myrmecia] bisecta]|uniref:Protein kinase domain-containing protein n=1 Tax=[Myrmecia] bisecta TaxID=41462 RepID=A0AAW1PWN3_9CHLO
MGELQNKGKRHSAYQITVKRSLGEGSFGQVFEGTLDAGGGVGRVVLKRVKTRVEGAAEMGYMEHLLNVYAQRAAKGSVADFMGYVDVSEDEATRNLTPGTWLMWRYEGNRTLAYYLKRRDCLEAIAQDMGIRPEAVCATVLLQLCEGLNALHQAGLVHRDVKPLNIIFAERERRFKLIDLGACADLRTGTNYIPDESILDANYCPPEQYCMPTDSPHLSRTLKPLALAMSPLLWVRHKPDRFDSYSTGLVLMQLAVPKLRTSSGLKNFNSALKRYNYDLYKWRDAERLPARQTAVLDADDGAGWDLAESLLRPREVKVDDNGGVSFVSRGGAIRLPIGIALKHRFMKQAIKPGTEPAGEYRRATTFLSLRMPERSRSGSRSGGSGSGSRSSSAGTSSGGTSNIRDESSGLANTATGAFGRAFGLFQSAKSKLFDLESKIQRQAAAVEIQTNRVQVLQRKAQQGEVSQTELRKTESALGKMQSRLGSLTDEFASTASTANRVFGNIMGRKKEAEASNTEEVKAEIVAAASKGRPAVAKWAWPKLDFGSRAKGEAGTSGSSSQPAGSSSRGGGFSNQGRGSGVERVQASQSGTGSMTAGKVATDAVYAGLKLTGLALNVASDLAAALRKDAEKALQSTEGAVVVKQASKAQSLAFMEMLRTAQPPMTGATQWMQASKAQSLAFMEMLRTAQPAVTGATQWTALALELEDDPRFQAVPMDRRREMFDSYQAAVRKVESQAQLRAIGGFKALLTEARLSSTDAWEAIEMQLSDDPRWAALSSAAERERLWYEHALRLKSAEDAAEAKLGAENTFRLLLEEVSPPLTAASSWALVKRQIWSDPRYRALTERRRREIFEEFHEVLVEVEEYNRSVSSFDEEDEPAFTAPPTAGVVLPIAGAGAANGARAVGEDPVEDEAMRTLRSEQSRLKEEYELMEAKLREMEGRLRMKEAVLSSLEEENLENPPVLVQDETGSLVFKFVSRDGREIEVSKNGSGMTSKVVKSEG